MSRRSLRQMSAGLLVAATAAAPLIAPAQTAPPPGQVVIVDVEAALAASAAGEALAEVEARERRALREQLDAVKSSLEAEEAELTELRDRLDKTEFDARVRKFDMRVRSERRDAQETVAALEQRFETAREALRRLVEPALFELMAERGAAIALDRRQVVAVAPSYDLTEALTAELDRRRPAASVGELLPSP